jgi:RNA polymerase sigma factor (sigma-70 family)
MTETDEQLLIQKAQKGDVPSFNLLVLHYQQPIYNLALRILGDSDDAADASQETFISAYKSIKSYRGGQWKSWLYRIATNSCYDQLRVKKRYKESSLDDEFENADLLGHPNTMVKREEPEDYALTQELVGELQAGLLELPVDQRTALVLCDVQGLSYDEISGIMATSVGTVRSRISRGRAKMRDYLTARGELLPRSYRHS